MMPGLTETLVALSPYLLAAAPLAFMFSMGCCCGCAPVAENELFFDDFSTDNIYNTGLPGEGPKCWWTSDSWEVTGGIIRPVINTTADIRRRHAALSTLNGAIIEVEVKAVSLRTLSYPIQITSPTGTIGNSAVYLQLQPGGGLKLFYPVSSSTTFSSAGVVAGDVIGLTITDVSSGAGTFDIEVFKNGVSVGVVTGKDLSITFGGAFDVGIGNDSSGGGSPQWDDFSLLATV